MDNNNNGMSIEEAFSRLDKIIKELQSGQLTLGESFKRYEEGMRLVRSTSMAIDKVEKKMQIIEAGMQDDNINASADKTSASANDIAGTDEFINRYGV